MQEITEQQDIAQEISEAFSQRVQFGDGFDEVGDNIKECDIMVDIEVASVLCLHRNIYRMYPNVRLVEEVKRGGKKERKTVNNNEVHHICVGTRHKETRRKLLNNTG
jgi:hypothetical protein